MRGVPPPEPENSNFEESDSLLDYEARPVPNGFSQRDATMIEQHLAELLARHPLHAQHGDVI